MDERERRLGLNEALFREVNERLRDLNETFSPMTNRVELICECANPACGERISFTVREYEELRADADRFVVTPGHEAANVEDVVATGDNWHIIRKRPGAPAKLAEATDPRA
jgi:hypothetical protein